LICNFIYKSNTIYFLFYFIFRAQELAQLPRNYSFHFDYSLWLAKICLKLYLNNVSTIGNDKTKDLCINNLRLAKDRIFPRKQFTIGSVKKLYTPITHFFECNNNCNDFDELIKFTCKIRVCTYNCKLGDFTNLNKHLKSHPETHK
jgi:hypothetical protein